MNELSNYSSTEILKFINDLKINHESLKNEVFKLLDDIDQIEIIINNKIVELKDIEKNYTILIEELTNRK
jgi:hypothetical protein